MSDNRPHFSLFVLIGLLTIVLVMLLIGYDRGGHYNKVDKFGCVDVEIELIEHVYWPQDAYVRVASITTVTELFCEKCELL